MKLLNDLSYLGFEIGSPTPSLNPGINPVILLPHTQTPASTSIMGSWMRRSFSIRGHKSSKNTNKNADNASATINQVKTSDDVQFTQTHRDPTVNDTVAPAGFETAQLPVWEQYKRNPVLDSFDFEVKAGDAGSTSQCPAKESSWSPEFESTKTPELTPDRPQGRNLPTTPDFSWKDTIGLFPQITGGTFRAHHPQFSETLNLSKHSNIIDALISTTTNLGFENLASDDRRAAILLWSNGVRPNTPDLSPSFTERHLLHDGLQSRPNTPCSPASRLQRRIRPGSFGWEETVRTADMTPQPLRIRSPYMPSNKKPTALLITPSAKPQLSNFQTLQRSPIRESLMPKPLTIRKARPVSVASSIHGEEDDEASIYGPDSPGEGNELNNLRYYQRFFNNRPLMRCLDTSDDEFLANNMYARLLEETKHKDRYRGELEMREFWHDVRVKLREEVEEIKNSLPFEDQEKPAWASGQRDTIDELLDGYGTARSPTGRFLLSSPSWASPWT